ncbi:MAG: hypothetical protein IJ468_05715 [Lachnospiraceae bacterium]|nr:hypothetical protein [Lachnospiraceae bacterium]
MNREKLYLEIGNIDDDLIEEAANTYGHRRYRSRVIRLIGIAACLCLLCIVVVFSQQREVICFNKGGLPVASKLLNASGEDTKLIPIDAQELFEYYGINPFPSILSGLRIVERDMYYVYEDPQGNRYDTNVIQYQSADGGQALSVVITKENPGYHETDGEGKRSRIDGVSLVLAVSDEKSGGLPVYWAEIGWEEVYLRIVSDRMDETSFVNAIREVIALLKK